MYSGRAVTRPRTILVVDDELSLRLLCRVNLELEGNRVLEAATLAEARAHLATAAVDVILLDVHVGREYGLDLIAEARPARIVLLTGSAEIDEKTRASVDAVLGKPFALEALSASIAADPIQ